MICHAVDQPRRQLQIAVVCQDDRLAQQAAAQCEARCIELRQMQAHGVVLQGQLRRQPAERRHDDAFTDTCSDRCPDDLDAVDLLSLRQTRIVLRRQDRDLMTAHPCVLATSPIHLVQGEQLTM